MAELDDSTREVAGQLVRELAPFLLKTRDPATDYVTARAFAFLTGTLRSGRLEDPVPLIRELSQLRNALQTSKSSAETNVAHLVAYIAQFTNQLESLCAPTEAEEEIIRQHLDHDAELRALYEEHQSLKRKLEELRAKHYLTSEKEFEEERMRKLKLASKDRMMAILDRYMAESQ